MDIHVVHLAVAVSVAFSALVNRVGYWLQLSALSLYSLVVGEMHAWRSFSSPAIGPAFTVCFQLDMSCANSSQVHVEVDVESSHISLADILEAEVWVSGCSLARGKLSIQDVLWDSAIVHPAHVYQPSEAALTEKSDHAGNLCALQYIVVQHAP